VTNLDDLLAGLAIELSAAGAGAVVLVGSHTRGTAHDLSDVDLYAVGEGPEYDTQRKEGVLITVSWRTPDSVRASFTTLPGCIQAVPGWRSARILADPDTVAKGLVREAQQWTWERVPDADGWCARELPGYAEEVQKLRAALRSGDHLSAAIWRNVLALRMASILAVQHRLLVEREEEIWPLVADRMRDEWRRAQRIALGLDGARLEESSEAAIELYAMAVEAIAPFMTERQLSVAWEP
jgi:hypothetical protein